uniref:Uncharacterized protein n=1 Tax=Arundo donax TaxID=35708 RepID=A0A0A9CUX1_ARUDO
MLIAVKNMKLTMEVKLNVSMPLLQMSHLNTTMFLVDIYQYYIVIYLIGPTCTKDMYWTKSCCIRIC